jgi:hypothetical protein
MDYTQRAVESILENEALTADLDDQAGGLLLDWATSLARQAAQGVAGMDEASAEEQFGARMRNVRQFIRQVNRWAGSPASGGGEPALSKALELAAPIYGVGAAALDASYVQPFSAEAGQLSQAGDRISSLRRLLENRTQG